MGVRVHLDGPVDTYHVRGDGDQRRGRRWRRYVNDDGSGCTGHTDTDTPHLTLHQREVLPLSSYMLIEHIR